MDNQLPSDFDLIIVGTGMVESILSAAASRIGKRVLHIDRNDYYGGQWASFNLDAIQKIQEKPVFQPSENLELHENEHVTPVGNNLFNIEDVTLNWHITGENLDEDKSDALDLEANNKADVLQDENIGIDVWTKGNLLKDTRKFNIDLTPKLQFARGDFVELLISSNIARYSEYRSVSRVLTWLNGQLEVVPCSRSDVFANSKVSVIEKRMLMKLLTSLDNEGEEIKNCTNKTFRAFLKDKKLTPNLIHYVLYAISMSTDETSCIEGVESTKRFLNSLGRFGKTPFLFSMYGSGEISQAFCRLSAVFGGVFALGQPLKNYVFDDAGFKYLVVGEQQIKADNIVMSIEKAPEEFVKDLPKEYISRAIFITDRSILDSEKEHLTLLLYPPENGKNPATIIELGSLTGTCPKNLFLVHLISRQNTKPHEDFEYIVNNLFTANVGKQGDCSRKPQILWSAYFSAPDSSGLDLIANIPKNVFICSGPDLDLDYDLAIKEAQKVFTRLYPNTEFLPRAPDPEEIVIEGEEETSEEVDGDREKESGSTVVEELVRNIQNQKIEETLSKESA